FYIYFQFSRNLQDEYYTSLRSKAYIIAEMVAGKKTDELEFEIQPPTELSSQLEGNYPENIALYTLDGKRVYTFIPGPDKIRSSALDEIRETGECHFNDGKFHALGMLYRNKLGETYIVVAEALFDQVHLYNLSRILLVVFLLSITLVAIGGWFFARQALSPVSDIMNEVDALLPTDMSHRLVTANQQDELSRLVITFNKLLDRIQHVFRIQKMFLSNISHELKNPLNVIISQVEITLDKERNTDDYQHTLASILSDAKDLNTVTDRLMQMARINADGSAIQLKPYRLDEIIWQAKDTLLKNHPEYTINFEVISLPEHEQKLFVLANEQLLKTALMNLMDNGCKFSPDKSVRISLAFPEDSGATVEIIDKGPGIPEEEQAMVFEAFYRSSKTSFVKGTGIGLALVESIVKIHQIDLKVISKLEGGTTFILKFPMYAGHS
ncbi:MAG: HAMP domain-containing sensor histidine kinase, partial [Saprospiraceae bacterium]